MAKTYDFTTGSGHKEAYLDLKVWEHRFILSPERWRTATSSVKLSWDWVPFDKTSKPDIPTERGLYAFVVEHCEAYFPPHGYIMYVGITGDVSRARNLRVRFGDYLRDAEKGGRSRVVVMLNMFKDNLYFYFAPLPDRTQSLSAIEKEMLAAIIPPCNADFIAEIAPAVRALR